LWLQISGVLLLFSIFLGLMTMLFESENYRRKYEISRLLEVMVDFEKLPENVKKMQRKCSLIEELNKLLNHFQMVLFFISILILFVSLVLALN
jgi:hypothetical protein